MNLNAPDFDDFLMERGDPAAVVAIRRPKRRKPAAQRAEPEAPANVADLLRQACGLAIARRGRIARETALRELTLLEVLTDALRRSE